GGGVRRDVEARRPRPGGRGDELDADRAGGARGHDGATAGAADDAEVRGGGAAHADGRYGQVGGAGRVRDAEARDRRALRGRRRAERLAAEVEPGGSVEHRYRRTRELARDDEQIR